MKKQCPECEGNMTEIKFTEYDSAFKIYRCEKCSTKFEVANAKTVINLDKLNDGGY